MRYPRETTPRDDLKANIGAWARPLEEESLSESGSDFESSQSSSDDDQDERFPPPPLLAKKLELHPTPTLARTPATKKRKHHMSQEEEASREYHKIRDSLRQAGKRKTLPNGPEEPRRTEREFKELEKEVVKWKNAAIHSPFGGAQNATGRPDFGERFVVLTIGEYEAIQTTFSDWQRAGLQTKFGGLLGPGIPDPGNPKTAMKRRRDAQGKQFAKKLKELREEYQKKLKAASAGKKNVNSSGNGNGNKSPARSVDEKDILLDVLGSPPHFKASEEVIRDNYYRLKDSVAHLTKTYFDHKTLQNGLVSPNCPQVVTKVIYSLTPNPEDILSEQSSASAFLEAFFWYHLQRVIFDVSSTHWASTYGPPLFEYYREVRGRSPPFPLFPHKKNPNHPPSSSLCKQVLPRAPSRTPQHPHPRGLPPRHPAWRSVTHP